MKVVVPSDRSDESEDKDEDEFPELISTTFSGQGEKNHKKGGGG